jgi:hypothetical protein
MLSSTGYRESLAPHSTGNNDSDLSNLRANLFGATSSSLRLKQPSNEIKQNAFESSKQEYIAECKRLLNGFKRIKQQEPAAKPAPANDLASGKTPALPVQQHSSTS